MKSHSGHFHSQSVSFSWTYLNCHFIVANKFASFKVLEVKCEISRGFTNKNIPIFKVAELEGGLWR